MKRIIMSAVVSTLLCAAPLARAQDAVSVDAKHYAVEFENDTVRVLRIRYAPGEKSVMHAHPDAVAIFLTDFKVKMNLPGGKSEVMSGKAGETHPNVAGVHQPENVGDKPMELILVELKGKATPAAPTNLKVTGTGH